jgi:uncharacterized protein YggU (UPF0235/DUF167 family)
VIITVRVHPRASRSKARWSGSLLEVWVTAAPVGGAANKAVIKVVADQLDVPVSALVMRSGRRSRMKVVEVLEGPVEFWNASEKGSEDRLRQRLTANPHQVAVSQVRSSGLAVIGCHPRRQRTLADERELEWTSADDRRRF